MEVRHPNREEIHPDREEYILIGNETSGKGTKHPDREEYILTGNETSGKGTNILTRKITSWQGRKNPDKKVCILKGKYKCWLERRIYLYIIYIKWQLKTLSCYSLHLRAICIQEQVRLAHLHNTLKDMFWPVYYLAKTGHLGFKHDDSHNICHVYLLSTQKRLQMF